MDEDIRKAFLAALDKSLQGSLGIETSADADRLLWNWRFSYPRTQP